MNNLKGNNIYVEELKSAIEDNKNDGFIIFNNILVKFSKPNSTPDYYLLLDAMNNLAHKFPPLWAQKIILHLSNTEIWMNCNEKVQTDMINFFVTLAFNFQDLYNNIIDLFIQIFYLRETISQKSLNYSTYRNVSIDFFVLLCKTIPQSTSVLVDFIIQKFPNWRKSTPELFWATYMIIFLLSTDKSANILTTSQKCSFLCTICTAVIDLELNPEGFEPENLINLFKNTKPKIMKIFETFDEQLLDKNIDSLMQFVQNVNQPTNAIVTTVSANSMMNDSCINSVWLKLELLSFLLIARMKLICSDINSDQSGPNKLNWDLLCAIIRCMRDLFSKYVLHVDTYLLVFPMICFYICSLRGGLIINFAEFLWTIIKDEHRDQASRFMALSYLTFFLICGKFSLIDLVIELMHDMSSWLVDYTYRYRRFLTNTCPNILLSENKIYYGLADALIYLFVQLHGSILDIDYYQTSCERLPICQIGLSPFKPYSQTPSDLFRLFIQIISVYRMSWSTISLIHSSQNTEQQITEFNDQDYLSFLTIEQLIGLRASKFFSVPLNKCQLSLSSKYIQPLFRIPTFGKMLMGHLNENSKKCTIDVEEIICTKRAKLKRSS